MSERSDAERSEAMTEEERELFEAAKAFDLQELGRIGEDAPTRLRFIIAKQALAREKLSREMPDWEAQFRTLYRASYITSRKLEDLTRVLSEAGISIQKLCDECGEE